MCISLQKSLWPSYLNISIRFILVHRSVTSIVAVQLSFLWNGIGMYFFEDYDMLHYKDIWYEQYLLLVF